MQCQKCGAENQEGFKFCLRCGEPLAAAAPPTPPPFPPPPVKQVDMDATLAAAPPYQPPAQPAPPPSYSPPAYTPPPAQPPAVQPVAPVCSAPPPSYTPPQGYTPPPPYGGQQAGYAPHKGLSQVDLSALNIWGPFAGFGARRRHQGWLMDNRGEKAPELTEKISRIYASRQIPNATFQLETLTARGLLVERRPYFMLRRGLVSLGLNISQFGKDLFISLVSYIKPPVSNGRVILLAASLLFWLFSSIMMPVMVRVQTAGLMGGLAGGLFGSAPSFDPGGLIFLACCLGPLAFVNNIGLIIFGLFSAYKWLTEKDVLAGLRVTPNEFNEDDLMAMEKAVEQTVWQALDGIGLDPDDLKPTALIDERRLI